MNRLERAVGLKKQFDDLTYNDDFVFCIQDRSIPVQVWVWRKELNSCNDTGNYTHKFEYIKENNIFKRLTGGHLADEDLLGLVSNEFLTKYQ